MPIGNSIINISAMENGKSPVINPRGTEIILNRPLAKMYSAITGNIFASRIHNIETGINSKKYFLFICPYLPMILWQAYIHAVL